MEWQQILGFFQVARLGSFTKAAEATFRTQSALSQQIKALEEELGCDLLERIGKRKLRLTTAGERLFAFARELLDKQARLLEELEALKGAPTGRLRLAAPFTTLYHLLPGQVEAYLADHPQVQLTILDRPQGKVIELVKAGEVDFGLAVESLIPPELAKVRWLPLTTVLLAPRGHPLAGEGRLTLWEIAQYPLILPPEGAPSPTRRLLEEKFRKLGIEYRLLMESSNVELTSLYVEMGLGLSFATVAQGLPSPARELELLPMDHYFPGDHLAICLRKDKVLTPFQQVFVDRLLESGQR